MFLENEVSESWVSARLRVVLGFIWFQARSWQVAVGISHADQATAGKHPIEL